MYTRIVHAYSILAWLYSYVCTYIDIYDVNRGPASSPRCAAMLEAPPAPPRTVRRHRDPPHGGCWGHGFGCTNTITKEAEGGANIGGCVTSPQLAPCVEPEGAEGRRARGGARLSRSLGLALSRCRLASETVPSSVVFGVFMSISALSVCFGGSAIHIVNPLRLPSCYIERCALCAMLINYARARVRHCNFLMLIEKKRLTRGEEARAKRFEKGKAHSDAGCWRN